VQTNVINSKKNAFTELDPEKTFQFDVGAQYHGEKSQVWFSAYAGIVNDYIMFQSVGNTSYVQNIDAYIAGAEVGFSRNVIGNVHFDSSLAYSWGEMQKSGKAMPQIPPLEGRFGLRYEETDWNIGVLWRLAAPQRRVAQGYGNVKGKDFSDSAGFGIVSINGSYRPADFITISAGIDNLFDKTYSEHLNKAGYQDLGLDADTRLNEPGINGWCKVSVEF
jgi:iron complex outermembrane receptor protein